MSSDAHRRHRGRAGGDAAAVSPLRHAPLREIVTERSDDYGLTVEVLSCGHEQRRKSDMIGDTYPTRRRCRQCGVDACAANGHAVSTAERGCSCGAAHEPFRHLWARHGITPDTMAARTLAELAELHDAEHYRNGVGVYRAPDGHLHTEVERGHVGWTVRR